MFSGHCKKPAAVTLLACLAATVLVTTFLPQHVLGRARVSPVTQPGDPDEFEARIDGRYVGGGAKQGSCGEPVYEGGASFSPNTPPDVAQNDPRKPRLTRKTIARQTIPRGARWFMRIFELVLPAR